MKKIYYSVRYTILPPIPDIHKFQIFSGNDPDFFKRKDV